MRIKKTLLTGLAALFCSTALSTIPTSSNAAGIISAGTGFDLSSGDYGEETTTEITYIPLNFKYENDLYALKMTIPYVRITSEEGNVVGGGSNVVVVPTGEEGSTSSESESGLGDIVASMTYFLYGGDQAQPLLPMVDLTAKVKFPTADEEKGLGTGEADYSIESDLTWFRGQTALFTTVGYKFMGSPDSYDLNNVLYGSVGVAHQVTSKISAGILYDLREASTDSGSATSEATGYGSFRIRDNVRLLLYGVKGFSDGSPDYGFGFTIGYSMDPSDIDWLAPVRRITNL
ncbi:MAG: transporter [Thermodesulfobacteriota bacterium]